VSTRAFTDCSSRSILLITARVRICRSLFHYCR